MIKKSENTPQYRKFKKISDEDNVLIRYLSKNLLLSNNSKILDVGGREGYISLSLASAKSVTIVENDPSVVPPKKPVKYYQNSIQEMNFEPETFDVILLSHVLGVLGRQNFQREAIEKALSWVKKEGTIILYYNTNSGYMGELLEFSKKNIKEIRYDYFNESIFSELKRVKIVENKVVTPIRYASFKELSKVCWYLFTACDYEAYRKDIENVAKIFFPKLEKDLSEPKIDIEQKIVFIKKIE